MDHAFFDRIDTFLTLEALDMAARRYKPPKELIFHSDWDVQNTTIVFWERLESYGGIQQSMHRKGNPYDNAVAENSSASSSASRSTSSITHPRPGCCICLHGDLL